MLLSTCMGVRQFWKAFPSWSHDEKGIRKRNAHLHHDTKAAPKRDIVVSRRISIKVTGEGTKKVAADELYLIKATIDWQPGPGSRRPYRVLAIPPRLSLYDLADAIVSAFGFDFDHVFGFYNNLRNWTKSTECYDLFVDDDDGLESWNEECKSVRRTRVQHVFRELKERFLFVFDFGDEWQFILRFEGTACRERNKKYPLVLKSVGNPPEQYPMVDDTIDDDIDEYVFDDEDDDTSDIDRAQ